MAGSSSSSSSTGTASQVSRTAEGVKSASKIPFMNKIMDYAKNPKYVMMFLAVLMLMGIGFMMYKKPGMMKNMLSGNKQKANPSPNVQNTVEEDNEESESYGQDL